MKKVPVFFILLMTLNINAQDKEEIKPIGKPYKTSNRKNPYIYIKGYFDYNIKAVPSINSNGPVDLNILKFNKVFSAFYTSQVMFDKFGMWDKEIRPTKEANPILFWERRKLFNDDDTLYNIFAYGEENDDEIYAGVLVFNEKNQDCLQAGNPSREKFIIYFSEGIKQLSDDKKFYDIYWDRIDKYLESKQIKRPDKFQTYYYK